MQKSVKLKTYPTKRDKVVVVVVVLINQPKERINIVMIVIYIVQQKFQLASILDFDWIIQRTRTVFLHSIFVNFTTFVQIAWIDDNFGIGKKHNRWS